MPLRVAAQACEQVLGRRVVPAPEHDEGRDREALAAVDAARHAHRLRQHHPPHERAHRGVDLRAGELAQVLLDGGLRHRSGGVAVGEGRPQRGSRAVPDEGRQVLEGWREARAEGDEGRPDGQLHRRTQPLGMVVGELEGGDHAHVVRHEVDPFEVECVEEGEQVAEPGQPLDPRIVRLCPAGPPQVGAEHAVPGRGDGRGDGVPLPPVLGEPVKQQDGLALADRGEVGAQARRLHDGVLEPGGLRKWGRPRLAGTGHVDRPSRDGTTSIVRQRVDGCPEPRPPDVSPPRPGPPGPRPARRRDAGCVRAAAPRGREGWTPGPWLAGRRAPRPPAR